MSYLVLHIDVEFIVGTVCANNGTSYPITNGSEELLWLYFHNNPHQHTISFGKDNKVHFNNSEVNYYGKFFESIEKEIEKFTIRGLEYPVINLLKESNLLETVRNAYQQKTLDDKEHIPTLISFSTSIGDNAKQKTVDYLQNHGFQIDSYSVPIVELTCYHAINQKKLKIANGSVAVFMEATNSTLHVVKLFFSDNYFLKDGKTVSYKGKGFDPRKRALIRFVVNEVNDVTGLLSTDDEKEEEIDRLEIKADDWLKRLDLQTRNMPLRIPSVSFRIAPNMRKDVMVRKNDLDEDTGQYTQDLKDIFDAFKSEYVQGNISAVFLLGNCFQNDRVKNSFIQMTGNERLHLYANEDIHDILAIYPKIDINRYSSEEARIKAQAEVEKLKQAELRALEDKQRKEEEATLKKAAEAQKAEQNRIEAQRLFERAVDLEKEGKLNDAKANADNALLLTPTNREYKQFFSDLVEKIERRNARDELYKSYLNNGDNYFKANCLEESLEEYEAAQTVFDNAEIIKKIIEVKRLIKSREQEYEKIVSSADVFFGEANWAEAKQQYEKALILRPREKGNQDKIKHCDDKIKEQEVVFNGLLAEATIAETKGKLPEALSLLEKAQKINPNNQNVHKRIKNIKFNLSFGTEKPPKKPKPKDHDFLGKFIDDDFLGLHKNK